MSALIACRIGLRSHKMVAHPHFRAPAPFSISMRSSLEKLLTCALLATYASIALLGEGLHSLVPHGHHLGDRVVECVAGDHDHCACCNDHEHEESQERALTAGGCIGDCHACEICEFLFQAVSAPPSIAASPDPHPFVADVPGTIHGLYSAAIFGLHAARGPPQLA